MDVYLRTNNCCHVLLQNRLRIRWMRHCEHQDERVCSDDANARVKSPPYRWVQASCIRIQASYIHACELLPYGSQLDVYEFL
mgnify:FL=1